MSEQHRPDELRTARIAEIVTEFIEDRDQTDERVALENLARALAMTEELADRLEAERSAGAAPLDVDVLTEALHALHSLEFWKWWEPTPEGGALIRSGPSPDFASAIAAEYARLAEGTDR